MKSYRNLMMHPLHCRDRYAPKKSHRSTDHSQTISGKIPHPPLNNLLTLLMLRLLSSKAQRRKLIEIHLNPVMLVFIG